MLLDATGSEVTFIYKNQFLRKLRSDQLETTLMVSNLVNPPQGGEFRPLPGSLFPEEFPFNYSEIFSYNYFWHKYYLSQRNMFALAKRPHYVNYEVLSNVMNGNVIDFSKADIYELKNTEMSREIFERVLFANNEFSLEKFAMRHKQM